MVTKWQWTLARLRRKIWFAVSLYGLLGVATALVAVMLRGFVPDAWVAHFGADSVGTILNILASSMLAVTTFSLSIMVQALASAATGATPRATQLLKDDRTTQRVLATFVGGFIFSLVGIIGLQSGIYQQNGRFVLFIATIAVIVVIVVNLLRWIAHLTDYGRLTDTISRVEDAAVAALTDRMANPYLGGNRLDMTTCALFERDGATVSAGTIGYVQMIDASALQDIAQDAKVEIAVPILPGSLVHRAQEIVRVMPGSAVNDDLVKKIRGAFAISSLRSFDQDPRFGILAMSEIASRALSPAINDPGTAIDILSRQLRILALWADEPQTEVRFPLMPVRALDLDDLMMDAFASSARDGAALVEVQIRLQKTLLALALSEPTHFAKAATHQAQRAICLAEQHLTLPQDLEALRGLVQQIEAIAD